MALDHAWLAVTHPFIGRDGCRAKKENNIRGLPLLVDDSNEADQVSRPTLLLSNLHLVVPHQKTTIVR